MSGIIYTAIENNQNKIIALLNSNQHIKRYLKYNSNNPLEVNEEQPDVMENLIDNQLILGYFDMSLNQVVQSNLYFYFSRGDFNREATGDFYYVIDLIIPIEYWRLVGTGHWRYTQIMGEIENMFHNKHVSGIGNTYIISSNAGHIEGTNYNMCHSVLKICNSVRGTY